MKFNMEAKLFVLMSIIINYNKTNDGKIMLSTNLQKFVFIFLNEYDANFEMGLVGYQPNNYGPYSFEVQDMVRLLHKIGMVNISDELKYTSYSITPKGNEMFENLCKNKEYIHMNSYIMGMIEFFNERNTKELLQYVYKNYPDFTVESDILDDVMGGIDSE